MDEDVYDDVEEILYDQTSDTKDWPSLDLNEAIRWFQVKLAEIPEASRASASLLIKGADAYDEAGNSMAQMVVSYTRPPTDADKAASREWRANHQRELDAQAREREAEDRRQYERLKTRFS